MKNDLCELLDIDFNPMYFEMNQLLLHTNYMEEFGNIKREIFISTLKKYLLGKLRENNVFIFDEAASVLEMVEYISSHQRDKDKLVNLIHYLLGIISVFQSFEAIWEVNFTFGVEERELCIHEGVLTKFETGEECDIYKSFAIIYCFFTDSLVLGDEVKRLELGGM